MRKKRGPKLKVISPILWSPTRLVQVTHTRKVTSDMIGFERDVEELVHVLLEHHVAVDQDQSLRGWARRSVVSIVPSHQRNEKS